MSRAKHTKDPRKQSTQRVLHTRLVYCSSSHARQTPVWAVATWRDAGGTKGSQIPKKEEDGWKKLFISGLLERVRRERKQSEKVGVRGAAPRSETQYRRKGMLEDASRMLANHTTVLKDLTQPKTDRHAYVYVRI